MEPTAYSVRSAPAFGSGSCLALGAVYRMDMESAMVELRERLESAAHAGEMVSIIYHGGSRAGIARRVLPVRVTEDVVWAIEADGEQRKQFKLAKIELAP